VVQYGVSVQKKASNIMMIIGIFAEDNRYSSEYIANYANVYVLDAIKRVQRRGSGADHGGAGPGHAHLDEPGPHGLPRDHHHDIQQAVARQNALYGAGQIGQQPTSDQVQLTFPVVTQAPFTDPAQYENIILRASQDGSAIVRLKDVARAEVGLRQYIIDSKLNGTPATFIAIYQQPGANGLEVSKAVRKTLEEMKPRCRSGLDYTDLARHHRFRAPFHRGGHPHAVRGDRAGRAGGLPLSPELPHHHHLHRGDCRGLISTFPGCSPWVFHQPAHPLRPGARHRHGGGRRHRGGGERGAQHAVHLSPKEATVKAMEEISSSLVAVVLVMASVFIPAAFLPGTTGQLYKQFAITIVISVASRGSWPSPSPRPCAGFMLKHTVAPHARLFRLVQPHGRRLTRGFGHAVTFVIKRMIVAFVVLAVLVYAIIHLFEVLPTSFVPNEDQGYVMAAVIMPDAASLNRTEEVSDRVERSSKTIPGVETRTQLNGYSLLDGGFKTNAGTFFVTLKPLRSATLPSSRPSAENARAVLSPPQGSRGIERDWSSPWRRRRSRASAPRGALNSGCRTRGRGIREAGRVDPAVPRQGPPAA
jgi:multidrug efflux pump